MEDMLPQGVKIRTALSKEGEKQLLGTKYHVDGYCEITDSDGGVTRHVFEFWG